VICAPNLRKHLTTSQCPWYEAANIGDRSPLSRKLISAWEVRVSDKEGQSPLFIASQLGHCDVVKCLLSSGADINLRNKGGTVICAPNLRKHLTTSQCPWYEAANIGDRSPLSRKLISAWEVSKHLTTSQCPWYQFT
jgi:ankyrin repeat protein